MLQCSFLLRTSLSFKGGCLSRKHLPAHHSQSHQCSLSQVGPRFQLELLEPTCSRAAVSIGPRSSSASMEDTFAEPARRVSQCASQSLYLDLAVTESKAPGCPAYLSPDGHVLAGAASGGFQISPFLQSLVCVCVWTFVLLILLCSVPWLGRPVRFS